MGAEGLSLAGVVNKGKVFEKNPNRKPPEGNEVASDVGRFCEAATMNVWTGRTDSNPELVKEAELCYHRLWQKLRWRFAHTLDYEAYAAVMRSLTEQEMVDAEVVVNRITGVKFGTIQKTTTWDSQGEVVNWGFIYNAMGLMVTLRQIVMPAFAFSNSPKEVWNRAERRIDGHIVPDIRGSFGQFDGVVLPPGSTTNNKDGVIEEIKCGTPYTIVELKVPLRPRRITGDNKIKNVFSWDTRQSFHRLGGFMLAHEGARLPEQMVWVYLRGMLPPVIHAQRFTDREYLQWLDQLDGLDLTKMSLDDEQRLKLLKESLALAVSDDPKRFGEKVYLQSDDDVRKRIEILTKRAEEEKMMEQLDMVQWGI